MKWLFLFVVLLNAAFFSWHSFTQKESVASDPVYAPPVSEKIQLLSEVPSNTDNLSSQVKSPNDHLETVLNEAISKASESKVGLICPRMEVERSEDRLQIENVLMKFGWRYKVDEVMGKRPKYWLYIPAPKTPESAKQIVKDLASKSIDSFIITREEMKNRISLGLYSSQERAKEALERIEKESGYKADVYEHMRNVTLQRIIVEKPVTEEDWEKFTSEFDLTKMMIKLEKNPC